METEYGEWSVGLSAVGLGAKTVGPRARRCGSRYNDTLSGVTLRILEIRFENYGFRLADAVWSWRPLLSCGPPIGSESLHSASH